MTGVLHRVSVGVDSETLAFIRLFYKPTRCYAGGSHFDAQILSSSAAFQPQYSRQKQTETLRVS